jgi:hypothetical protein
VRPDPTGRPVPDRRRGPRIPAILTILSKGG